MNVLEQLHCNNLEICDFLGDNPKRAFIRCSLNHASTYPCEYCYAKGALFRNPHVSTTSKKKENEEFQTQIDSLSQISGLENHIDFLHKKNKNFHRHKLDMAELVLAGQLTQGMVIYVRNKIFFRLLMKFRKTKTLRRMKKKVLRDTHLY